MRHTDVADDAEVRTNHRLEAMHFARLAYACFDDGELVLGAKPEQRERDADLGVVAPRAAMQRELAREYSGEHLLDDRLAVGASDADDACAEPCSPGAGDRLQGLERVVDAYHWQVLWDTSPSLDEGGCDAARLCLGEECVAIEPLAAQCDEQGRQTRVNERARVEDDILDEQVAGGEDIWCFERALACGCHPPERQPWLSHPRARAADGLARCPRRFWVRCRWRAR